MKLVKDAVTTRPFAQLPFMSESSFASFLRDRGFSVWSGGIPSFVDSGLIDRLPTPNGDFHPFQMWPISHVFRELDVPPDSGVSVWGLDPEGLKKCMELNWPRRAKFLVDFPKSDTCLEFNVKILPLLLWLESHFLPIIRGPRPGVITLTNSDLHQWHGWTKRSQLKDLLDKHSISVEQLSDWRARILSDALHYDSSPDLYLLLRSIPFDRRNYWRGSLRLAYDLYEIAEIIRLCLEQVSENAVTKEWDPQGHPNAHWVQEFYGSQPEFGAPAFLRNVIRRYGLDPAYRARWLVEGATEEGFIVRYAERLGADIREFVSIREFGGDGAFKKEQPAIDSDLKAAKEEQCFVTLTFDDTRGARRRLKGLLDERLINLPFALNDPDFELENFTEDQLVAVAVNWATNLKQPIKMCQGALVRKVKSRISMKNEDFRKAFNAVLYMNDEIFHASVVCGDSARAWNGGRDWPTTSVIKGNRKPRQRTLQNIPCPK